MKLADDIQKLKRMWLFLVLIGGICHAFEPRTAEMVPAC